METLQQRIVRADLKIAASQAAVIEAKLKASQLKTKQRGIEHVAKYTANKEARAQRTHKLILLGTYLEHKMSKTDIPGSDEKEGMQLFFTSLKDRKFLGFEI